MLYIIDSLLKALYKHIPRWPTSGFYQTMYVCISFPCNKGMRTLLRFNGVGIIFIEFCSVWVNIVCSAFKEPLLSTTKVEYLIQSSNMLAPKQTTSTLRKCILIAMHERKVVQSGPGHYRGARGEAGGPRGGRTSSIVWSAGVFIHISITKMRSRSELLLFGRVNLCHYNLSPYKLQRQ